MNINIVEQLNKTTLTIVRSKVYILVFGNTNYIWYTENNYIGEIKMIGQYLITFREVLEAALIVTIIFAYFNRSNRGHLKKYVWQGTILAIIVSSIIAIAVAILYGGLSSADAKLFEGVAAIIAVIVLTTMIIWMSLKGSNLKNEISEKVSQTVEKGTIVGLIAFSFIVVFREGFETVLFLIPFGAIDAAGTIIGAFLGIFSALLISYMIYKIGLKIDLGKFFYLSSVLLILLAAGLLGYGVHEILSYQNAIGADTGWLGVYAFDLGIEKGSLFHHKGAVGSIFAVMFGYSVKMEWGRIIAHSTYLIIFLPLTIIAYRRPEMLDNMRKMILRFIPQKQEIGNIRESEKEIEDQKQVQ